MQTSGFWYSTGMDTDVQQIKDRINIVDIVGQYVKLRKAGRTYMGLCPFHKEKTPSFYLQPKKNRFHCYGCGEKGGPLRLDVCLCRGGKIYPIIAERAKLTEILPSLSLNLIISAEQQQHHSEQREYLTVLREALLREQYHS